MSIRLSLVFLLLVSICGADVLAQRPNRRNRSKTQQKPLSERDPELSQWIDTLILNLQKDHKTIRNSAAQGLIAVGAESAPMLLALRERVPSKQRRVITRILERINRGSGRNLFKADAGGKAPSSLAQELSAALKLNKEKTQRLKDIITKVQERKRGIDRAFRKKEIKARQRLDRLKRMRQELDAELALFLDRQAVDFIVVKLGLNPRAEKDRNPEQEEKELERRRRNADSGGH